jgi:hypothetical protein
MNPCDYFVWDCLIYCVLSTKPYAVQELKAEIEVITEQITGDTADKFMVYLQWAHPRGPRISYWTSVHMMNTCTQITRFRVLENDLSPKLLFPFMNILYKSTTE